VPSGQAECNMAEGHVFSQPNTRVCFYSSAVSLGPINPLPGDLSDLSFLGIGLGMQLIFANIIRFL